jgi:uncharacterized protein (TIGR02996 family)
MTDHDALLAAVLADPDNDLPRLVFADWLEESGHPANAARAKFIRLQIEAERNPEKSAKRFECTRQAEELRPTFRDEWDRVFPPGELSHTTVGRRRGFVEEVETGLTEFRQSGNAMFAVAPVRSLGLMPDEDILVFRSFDWTELAGMEYLGRLARLRFGPGLWEFGQASPVENFRASPLTGLARCPHLGAVRTLTLAGNGLDNHWVVRFVHVLPTVSFGRSLTELDLSNNAITDAGANTLAAGRGLEGLVSLRLTGNRIGPDGQAMLRHRFGPLVQL